MAAEHNFLLSLCGEISDDEAVDFGDKIFDFAAELANEINCDVGMIGNPDPKDDNG